MVHQARTLAQLAEALGSLNKYYCSQRLCCEVSDPNTLIKYFVLSGGAEDFARRWDEATGEVNKYFCSEFYRQPIEDERSPLELLHDPSRRLRLR